MITNVKSKEELDTQIQENLKELNNLQNLYNTKIQIFSTCIQNINDEIQKNTKKEEIDYFMLLLSKSKKSIDLLRNQKDLIMKSTSLLKTIQEQSDNSQDEVSQSKLDQFNELYKNCRTNLYDNYVNDANLILDYIKTSVLVSQIPQEHLDSQENKISTNPTHQNNQSINSTNEFITKDDYSFNENEDNTTLLISEVQNKVVLPYKISDLKNTLQNNNNYNNIQELVNDKYVFPLNNFKNSSTSRFKEGFSLMRKKEKASLLDSLDLAFEVTFNNSLNPAIIAACKDLSELDNYLYCLETNELDKFNCFNIKYEMLPTTTKNETL